MIFLIPKGKNYERKQCENKGSWTFQTQIQEKNQSTFIDLLLEHISANAVIINKLYTRQIHAFSPLQPKLCDVDGRSPPKGKNVGIWWEFQIPIENCIKNTPLLQNNFKPHSLKSFSSLTHHEHRTAAAWGCSERPCCRALTYMEKR